ncbi:MAG: NADP(H)-dependent aldo-keto reductase [Alphaproteobacteria bacterium CG_4_10_14_0_2_um_filter_63_37]|nr:MAG: aldo/keto reductase [Proteobacteria bacterium CG1_02_64_396]PJA24202.1 MAG: NADP(H)-dependent aldo-keto reductase [Alphaproteobacteria bacterium CG_4_10_14_0_2_um_filter_63_37]
MEYRTLGTTDLQVSAIGLGTMTWGQQNIPEEAYAQLDLAVEAGVNFIDTAEMYPVPAKAETQGATETILGRWLKRRGGKGDLIVATKAAARADWLPWLRGGPRLNRDHLRRAVDASLQRLGIETIDLYQMHWPERKTNYFGRLGYNHQQGDEGVAIEETLAALGELVAEGKIRHVGLSNETPWGMMAFLRAAAQQGLPRMMSIQNPYNLLNRTFEIGCAEVAVRESMGLLAYSPLAMGTLAGKYLAGARPAQARLTLFPQFNRYMGAQAQAATAEYVQLAHSSGLKPAQMALAFVTSRPFVTSNLIGATTVEQLRQNLDSAKVVLSQEVLEAIEAIQRKYPNPAP